MRTGFVLLLGGIAWLIELGAVPAWAGQTLVRLHEFGSVTNNDTGFSPQGPLIQGPDGALYGITQNGGAFGNGSVFRVNPDGTAFTNLHSFGPGGLAASAVYTNNDGIRPNGGLALFGSTLYGTASAGGANGEGTVFEVNTDGTSFATLHTFDGNDGAQPNGKLLLANGVLYGTTAGGGVGQGTVFGMATNGVSFASLYSFSGAPDGAMPNGALISLGSKLYGTTFSGGLSNYGVVFGLDIDGGGFHLLHSFTNKLQGTYPRGGLVLSGSALFGTTQRGGSIPTNRAGNTWDFGTVFEVNPDGTGFRSLASFASTNGGVYPGGELLLSSSGTLYGVTGQGPYGMEYGTIFQISTNGSDLKIFQRVASSTALTVPYGDSALAGGIVYGTSTAGGTWGFGGIFALSTNDGGVTNLYSFTGPEDGVAPWSDLVLSGNTVFGTTFSGGSRGLGTVFRVNTDGSGWTNLHSFNLADGANPFAGVTLAGNFLYGATYYGGALGSGTVFRVGIDGSGFTNLCTFAGTNGANPYGRLVQSGNTLYGTTVNGGAYAAPIAGGGSFGTVFSLNADGTGFTNIHTFNSFLEGANPYGGLVLADNSVYGCTEVSSTGCGALFKLNLAEPITAVLHVFNCLEDGASPKAALAPAGATFYGVASSGGSSAGAGIVFRVNNDGTGFTNLHTFYGPDGAAPQGALLVAGNTLYGTTFAGGTNSNGTVFALNNDGGAFTNLYVFQGSDGQNPNAALVQTAGHLFGTTVSGGTWSNGVVFALALPPPRLDILAARNSVSLVWSESAATLQSAPEVTGIFTDIPSATSPYLVPSTGPRRFFRLRTN